MNYKKIIVVLLLLCFLLPPFAVREVRGEERGEVKTELKDLREMMEKMRERIEELEKRNGVLERQAKQEDAVTVEEGVDLVAVEGSTTTMAKGFLRAASNTFNPDVSVIGTFTPTWYSLDEPAKPLAEVDPQNTGVALPEIELGLQGVVDPYFRYDTFLVFGPHGVEIEEAYGTTLLSLPLNSQFRIGRSRAKFGRINQLHRHNQNFVTLPLPASQFLGEHLNPTSVEANFLVPAPWFLELSASAGSPDVHTPTFARDVDGNNISKLLYNFHLANFFEVSESLGVSLGGSFATGANKQELEGDEPFFGRSKLYGIDLFAKYRPLKNNPYQEVTLQSEFIYLDADRAHEAHDEPGHKHEDDHDGHEDEVHERKQERIKNWGWYSQMVYRFAKRWNTGFRFGMIDTDTPVDEEELHEDGENGHDDEHAHGEGTLGLLGRTYRLSPMLTFNPTEFSRIRLQYDYLNRDFSENQHAVFLQFQYSIGAHGAHPF